MFFVRGPACLGCQNLAIVFLVLESLQLATMCQSWLMPSWTIQPQINLHAAKRLASISWYHFTVDLSTPASAWKCHSHALYRVQIHADTKYALSINILRSAVPTISQTTNTEYPTPILGEKIQNPPQFLFLYLWILCHNMSKVVVDVFQLPKQHSKMKCITCTSPKWVNQSPVPDL